MTRSSSSEIPEQPTFNGTVVGHISSFEHVIQYFGNYLQARVWPGCASECNIGDKVVVKPYPEAGYNLVVGSAAPNPHPLLIQRGHLSPDTVSVDDLAYLNESTWAYRRQSGSGYLACDLRNYRGILFRTLAYIGNSIGVYASANIGQLQRSTDGGATWENVGPTPIADVGHGFGWGVAGIADAGTAFYLIATPAVGHFTTTAFGEIWKSVDLGKTWNKIYGGFSGWGASFSKITANPDKPGIIAIVSYLSFDIEYILYSTNDGASWKLSSNDLGQNVIQNSNIAMLDNGRILITGGIPAIYSDDYETFNTACFIGDAGGINNVWFQYGTDIQVGPNGVAFYTSVGGGDIPPGSAQARTIDYGANWELIFYSFPYCESILYNPNTDILYLATAEQVGGSGGQVPIINAFYGATTSPLPAPFKESVFNVAGQHTSSEYQGLEFNLNALFTSDLDGMKSISQRGMCLDPLSA